MIDRRNFLVASVGLVAACAGTTIEAQPPSADFRPLLAGLGQGARLGVAALDTGTGRTLRHDADSRYAMCSVFKAPLAAAILSEAEAGRLRLDEEIAFGRADLVAYAPVAEANLERGRLTVELLCAAIVEVSDNAAANLLLARVGGPAGLTAFTRAAGDATTRLDRTEPALNTNLPGDPRDTTTPAAMVGLMRSLLLGEVLRPESRERLITWLERCSTGRERLRAGLPPTWRAGDKTGTGNGANNDVAIAWPPGRAPILIASFIDARRAIPGAGNAVHAAVATIIAEALG